MRVDQAYRTLETALDRYAGLVERTGMNILPGQEADSIAAERTNIQLQLKELFNLGVLNGPDLMLMEQMLPDPRVNLLSGMNPWGTSSMGLENIPLLGGDAAARVSAGVNRLKEILRELRNSQVGAVGLPPIPPPSGAGRASTGGAPAARRRRYNPATGELEASP